MLASARSPTFHLPSRCHMRLSSMQDVKITALGPLAPLAAANESGGCRALPLACCAEGSCSKTSCTVAKDDHSAQFRPITVLLWHMVSYYIISCHAVHSTASHSTVQYSKVQYSIVGGAPGHRV